MATPSDRVCVAMDNTHRYCYNKGAEVIRMYATLLGWPGFRKGMDLYFQRHDGTAVTCDDFRSAMADANGVDLTQFERWYTQAGTPTVELSDKKIADGAFSLTLSQSCADTPNQPASEKQPFHIPVSCALFDKKTGKKVDEQLFELREASQTFSFSSTVTGSPDDYVVSLLRGFSAPVTAKQALTQDELLFLASNDDDSLNRWDAAQQIYTRAILDEFTGDAETSMVDAAVATFERLSMIRRRSLIKSVESRRARLLGVGFEARRRLRPRQVVRGVVECQEGARQGLFHGTEGGLRFLIFGRALRRRSGVRRQEETAKRVSRESRAGRRLRAAVREAL